MRSSRSSTATSPVARLSAAPPRGAPPPSAPARHRRAPPRSTTAPRPRPGEPPDGASGSAEAPCRRPSARGRARSAPRAARHAVRPGTGHPQGRAAADGEVALPGDRIRLVDPHHRGGVREGWGRRTRARPRRPVEQPARSRGASSTSGVVPGAASRSPHPLCASRLIRLDLPAFGGPTTATGQAGAPALAPMAVRKMRRHFGRQLPDLRRHARQQVLRHVLPPGRNRSWPRAGRPRRTCGHDW